MSPRLRLVVAAVLAAGAGVGSYLFLSNLQERVTVVVAARDIPPRTVVTADMLVQEAVSARDAAVLAPAAFARPDQVVGAVARAFIPRGQVLQMDGRDLVFGDALKVAKDRAGQVNLSYFVPGSMRAEAVAVDTQGAVGFKVKEGDRVDVIFTSRADNTGGVYSAAVLQNVQVLSVETITDETTGARAKNVVLLVTPAEAVDLALAKRLGFIDLVLNPLDAQPVPLSPSSPLKFTRPAGGRQP